MRDSRQLAATWRLIVMFEAQRAGLDPARVLALPGSKPRAASREWLRLNGCRQTAIYLAHTVFGFSYAEIQSVAGTSPPGITQIVHAIEDAREDDQAVEAWLSTVEEALYG